MISFLLATIFACVILPVAFSQTGTCFDTSTKNATAVVSLYTWSIHGDYIKRPDGTPSHSNDVICEGLHVPNCEKMVIYRIARQLVTVRNCYCCPGYTGDCSRDGCSPICNPPCGEHGQCVQPNQCKCQMGWSGQICDQPLASTRHLTTPPITTTQPQTSQDYKITDEETTSTTSSTPPMLLLSSSSPQPTTKSPVTDKTGRNQITEKINKDNPETKKTIAIYSSVSAILTLCLAAATAVFWMMKNRKRKRLLENNETTNKSKVQKQKPDLPPRTNLRLPQFRLGLNLSEPSQQSPTESYDKPLESPPSTDDNLLFTYHP